MSPARGDAPPQATGRSVAQPALRITGELVERAGSPKEKATVDPFLGSQPLIESLVLGHLPVLATTWVVPYVRQRSVEIGRPVALVRIADGECTIDVVTAMTADLPALTADGTDLDAAVRCVSPHVGAWILRVSEVAEQETIASPGIACITLLTGADEAATVASYRTLKNLPPKAAPARIRLAIMGSSVEVARLAEQRIRHAAQAYLETVIEPATIIAKVTSGGLKNAFTGTFDWTLQRLLTAVADASTPKEPAGAVPDIGAAAADAGSRPSVTASSGTNPMTHPIAGLVELATRCPYAPEVGLATDASGDLHLCVSTGRGTALNDPGMGVQRLLTAASWAADHAALLAAVHSGLRQDAAADGPSLHLLTDEPKDVRRLLDTGVRLHLLIDAGDAGGVRICRELN